MGRTPPSRFSNNGNKSQNSCSGNGPRDSIACTNAAKVSRSASNPEAELSGVETIERLGGAVTKTTRSPSMLGRRRQMHMNAVGHADL
eukprot:6659198-Pyramimonas_sp.AAC.1